MPKPSYRLRRPALAWAICGPVTAGFSAAAIFGILGILAMEFWDVVASSHDSFSWNLIVSVLPYVIMASIFASIPAVLMIGVLSVLIFEKVQGRSAPTRSAVFGGYERYVWLCLTLMPLVYPLLVPLFSPGGINRIGFDPIFVASLFPVILITAAIARPIFLRIVTVTERPLRDGTGTSGA